VNGKHIVTTYELTQIKSCETIERMNKRLSAMRYIVEMAFGILKCRFRILLNAIQYGQDSTESICVLILAVMILHNFLIIENVTFASDDLESTMADYQRRYPNPTQAAATEFNQERTRDLIEEYCKYFYQ
jgi:hypothetical protein